MALHANFAGALCITEHLAQSILHLYYSDGAFPAKFSSSNSLKLPKVKDPVTKQNLPDRYLDYDLFLAEPILDFSPRSDDRLSVHLRLNGELTFSSAAFPGISSQIQIDFDIAGRISTFDTGTSLQFGIDLLGAPISNFQAVIYSGSNPTENYQFNPNNSLQSMLLLAIWTMDTTRWRITPPGFDELRSLNLITDSFVPIRSFGETATLAVNISGLTNGNPQSLIDLFNTSQEHGFYSTYSMFIPLGDDEYGTPIYGTGWIGVQKYPNGKHGGGLAISINNSIIMQLYNGIFRNMIMDEFEKEKQRAIDKAKKKAKDENKPYKEPSIASISINSLNLSLKDDYVLVSGEAEKDGIDADFSMKMRFVSTDVEGSTDFIYNNQGLVGMRPEVYDVDVETPWWITFIQVIVGVVGLGLAAFTFLISAFVAFFVDVVLGSVVHNMIYNAENKLNKNVAKQMSKQNGVFKFTLPQTDGPELSIRPNDITIDPGGLNFWFSIGGTYPKAKLLLKKYPHSKSWPVMDRNAILVQWSHSVGFYHPDDKKVRIRWEVFAETKGNKLFQYDFPINPGANTGPYYAVTNPKLIAIHHAKEEYEAYEKYIVTCRVYRPWGTATQELWSGETEVSIIDRLKRDKPYVQWIRNAFYQNYSAKIGDPNREPLGWTEARRFYAIHKTDPDERCRFADRYTYKLKKTELKYMDELPFPEEDLHLHTKEICEYCFFGGPDKVGPKKKKPGKEKPTPPTPPKPPNDRLKIGRKIFAKKAIKRRIMKKL